MTDREPQATAESFGDDCEDYEDYEAEECDHEDATVDVLTGEMSCRCGYRRGLSGEEIEREAQLQAEAMEAYYAECERDD